MSSNRQYTDELKSEAVKQVVERGLTVVDVATRIGIPRHTLYGWVQSASKASGPTAGTVAPTSDSAEVRRLKAELKRVTEERGILKTPPRTLPGGEGEVRVHARACWGVSPVHYVPGAGSFRSGLSIHEQRLAVVPEGAPNVAEHESSRQRSRQRGRGKLLQCLKEGTHQTPDLPHASCRSFRRLRLHRDVLQPDPSAWFRRRRVTVSV